MTPHRSLPLRRVDGYLPIEDHGLIGDGTSAALVGRDGAVSWLCIPRFDSPPLFCGLLDRVRGGAFTVAPEPLLDSRQWYEEDSAVLVTELRGPDGTLQITDALTLRAGADLTEDAPSGRGELLRRVTVLHGRVRLRVELEPRDGAFATRRAEGLALRLRTRPRACPASGQQPPAGETPLISVLLTFARTPWYSGYAATTAPWGLDPLTDQRLAGGIMWIPAGGIYLAAALVLLVTWIRATEREDVML